MQWDGFEILGFGDVDSLPFGQVDKDVVEELVGFHLGVVWVLFSEDGCVVSCEVPDVILGEEQGRWVEGSLDGFLQLRAEDPDGQPLLELLQAFVRWHEVDDPRDSPVGLILVIGFLDFVGILYLLPGSSLGCGDVHCEVAEEVSLSPGFGDDHGPLHDFAGQGDGLLQLIWGSVQQDADDDPLDVGGFCVEFGFQ